MIIIKLIKRLTDEDFNIQSIPFHNPRHRYGARGIIFNEKNEIAILHKQKKKEYKLIGGGIENKEDPIIAFKRETLEETGCKIEIDKFLGIFEEFKSLDNFKQTSYIYVAHVINCNRKPKFTEKEIKEGSKFLWLSINEAKKKIKESENKILPSKYENIYHTKFIIRRDYEILKYYTNTYSNK